MKKTLFSIALSSAFFFVMGLLVFAKANSLKQTRATAQSEDTLTHFNPAASKNSLNMDLSSQSKTKTFYFPKIDGVRGDATVWEWDGTPGTHETAKRQAADMYCSYALEKDATSVRFEVVSSDRKGTERFKEDGSHSYCKFCKDFFSSVTCKASN